MAFFNKLFRKKKRVESVVLIDIAADSVAGAYACFSEGETPALLYAKRLSMEMRESEPHEHAIMQALGTLGNELIREGAPALIRATGSGSANTILVSIDTPWQETNVRIENFERGNSFIFTKSIVAAALENTSVVPHGKTLADESILSTILNGYETRDPYERKIRRASVTVLTSFIEKNIFDAIVSAFRSIFHTKHILMIAGSSLRYQAMRAAFPHERNPDVSSLKQALEAADSGKLWIPGYPPKVISVLASHISSSVRQTTTTPPDLQLLLMALYFQHRASRP
ncbi:MAG: hypothetical protein NTY93_00795 [Candidatus Kaiserbacteria bacterium]|nr:hypothetical protein [Candidatus Kaiserbacteria bacterium]